MRIACMLPLSLTKEGGCQASTSPFRLQEELLQGNLPIRVDASTNPPVYKFEDDSELGRELHKQHTQFARAIIAHMLDAHKEYLGQSSAGTIVRVAWDDYQEAPLSHAKVLDIVRQWVQRSVHNL